MVPLTYQTSAGRSAGEVVDDGTIITKVKIKLFADKQLSGFAISVDTFKGEEGKQPLKNQVNIIGLDFQYTLRQGIPSLSNAALNSLPFFRKKSFFMAYSMPYFLYTQSA